MRRRTPARGLPTWPEEEVTPPPHDLPLIPPDIAPDIASQLDMLRSGITDARQLAYDGRVRSERLDKLDDTIGALAKSVNQTEALLAQYLRPQLDHWRAITDGIARDLPGVLDKLDAIGEAFERFDRRLRDLEVSTRVSAERLTASQDAIVARLTHVETRAADVALRVIEIEKREHGREWAARSLAKRETKKNGAWAAAVAAVVTAASQLWTHFR